MRYVTWTLSKNPLFRDDQPIDKHIPDLVDVTFNLIMIRTGHLLSRYLTTRLIVISLLITDGSPLDVDYVD